MWEACLLRYWNHMNECEQREILRPSALLRALAERGLLAFSDSWGVLPLTAHTHDGTLTGARVVEGVRLPVWEVRLPCGAGFSGTQRVEAEEAGLNT